MGGSWRGIWDSGRIFIFVMMKLMQMTQKRKCEYAQIKPLIAGVRWESDGRDVLQCAGEGEVGAGERQLVHPLVQGKR